MLANLTTAERRQVAIGGTAALKTILDKKSGGAAQAAASATPAPAAPEPTAANPEAPTPQAPQATAEDDDQGDELKKMRVLPKDFQEREVIRLMKPSRDAQGNEVPGLSLRDAYLKVYGTTTPQQAQAPQGEQPNATPAAAPQEPAADPALQGYDTQLSELSAKIEKLSKERDQAREEIENAKADKLSDEIADARAELKLLTHERNGYLRQKETSQVRSLEQQITSSRDRALAQYPDLQAADSMARLALDGYVQNALADPKRATFFADPTWPEKITAEFASKHGLRKTGSSAATSPAATPSATPPKAAPQPAPTPQLRPRPQQVPGARLMTSADGGQPSATPQATVEELRAALPRMNAAQRRELISRMAKSGAR